MSSGFFARLVSALEGSRLREQKHPHNSPHNMILVGLEPTIPGSGCQRNAAS